ncbi:MAG: NADPH-dependent 7-cyano-7-deazaguanine reductase QueF [Desulfuromonadales bacterium]|nr:NADPH-dependent 7-cyano-7-deazaguanine reductase QueF [Desulfuromonadales bacterium]
MTDFEANTPLGKATAYRSEYDPSLLAPFPRQLKRDELGLGVNLPFNGIDIWNAYELSWLAPSGKPVVAMAEFRFPCASPNLIESKSFKLYLNSFNQTRIRSSEALLETLTTDLSQASGAAVHVFLTDLDDPAAWHIGRLPGVCIDDLDLSDVTYALDPQLLANATDKKEIVAEELHSHLLKSNCLVTRQPDWGSVLIRYHGPKIDRAALLRYLISFRQHNEFHEQCVERIFTDLIRFCEPEQLTVYARYTRRGGLDINPFRSNFEETVDNLRLVRQ